MLAGHCEDPYANYIIQSAMMEISHHIGIIIAIALVPLKDNFKYSNGRHIVDNILKYYPMVANSKKHNYNARKYKYTRSPCWIVKRIIEVNVCLYVSLIMCHIHIHAYI